VTSGGNNFNDFPENQLPKFHRIGMAPPYQISDWYRFRCHCVESQMVYVVFGLLQRVHGVLDEDRK